MSAFSLKHEFNHTFPETTGKGQFYVDNKTNQAVWFDGDFDLMGSIGYFIWMQNRVCCRVEIELKEITNKIYGLTGMLDYSGFHRNICLHFNDLTLFPAVKVRLTIGSFANPTLSYRFASKKEEDAEVTEAQVASKVIKIADDYVDEMNNDEILYEHLNNFHCEKAAFIAPDSEAAIFSDAEKGSDDSIILLMVRNGEVATFDTTSAIIVNDNKVEIPPCHPWLSANDQFKRLSRPIYDVKTEEVTIYRKIIRHSKLTTVKYVLKKLPAYNDFDGIP